MIDFVVQGTPRSQQAKNKKGWIERVQRAVPSTADLLEGPLRVRIDFFFRCSTDLDTDNIISRSKTRSRKSSTMTTRPS